MKTGTKILTITDDTSEEFLFYGEELVADIGPLQALRPISYSLVFLTRSDFGQLAVKGLPVEQKFRTDIMDSHDFPLTSIDSSHQNIGYDQDGKWIRP